MFKFLKKSKEVAIIAPMTGEVIDIIETPDQVFAEKMVGDGVAIKPTNGVVVSPCNGEIVQIFPTNHAIGIKTKEGLEILIHIGLDTVELNGEGFKAFVNSGDKVKIGDKLLEVDFNFIEKSGKSIVSPVIITNPDFTKEIHKQLGTAEKGKNEIINVILG